MKSVTFGRIPSLLSNKSAAKDIDDEEADVPKKRQSMVLDKNEIPRTNGRRTSVAHAMVAEPSVKNPLRKDMMGIRDSLLEQRERKDSKSLQAKEGEVTTHAVLQAQREVREDAEDQRKLAELLEVNLPEIERLPYKLGFIFAGLLHLAMMGAETECTSTLTCNVFYLTNFVCVAIYLGEVSLRFATYGFNKATADKFTIADVAIIASATADMSMGGSVMRALPAFRLLRYFPLFIRLGERLDTTGNMNCLLCGCRSTVRTLGWLFIVLLLVMWPTSGLSQVALGQSGEFALLDPDKDIEDVEPFSTWDNVLYFGTTVGSLFSLSVLHTKSGWVDSIARPVFQKYEVSLLFFGLYYFLAIGLGLSIVATFLEAAVKASSEGNKANKLREAEERKRISNDVMEIIQIIDENQDGELSAEELDKALVHDPIRRALQNLGVPGNASGAAIVAMIDQSGDGLISYEEFARRLSELNNDITIRDYNKLVMRMHSVHMRAKTFQPRMLRLSSRLTDARRRFEESMTTMEVWLETNKTKVVMDEAFKTATSGHALPLRFGAYEEQKKIKKQVQAQLDEEAGREARQALHTVQRLVGVDPERFKPATAPHYGAVPPPLGLPGQIITDEDAEQRVVVNRQRRALVKQPRLPSSPPPYGRAYQKVKEEERKILEQDATMQELNPFCKESIENARQFRKDIRDLLATDGMRRPPRR